MFVLLSDYAGNNDRALREDYITTQSKPHSESRLNTQGS